MGLFNICTDFKKFSMLLLFKFLIFTNVIIRVNFSVLVDSYLEYCISYCGALTKFNAMHKVYLVSNIPATQYVLTWTTTFNGECQAPRCKNLKKNHKLGLGATICNGKQSAPGTCRFFKTLLPCINITLCVLQRSTATKCTSRVTFFQPTIQLGGVNMLC